MIDGEESGSAAPQCGNEGNLDSPHRGWYSRGYLPHYDAGEVYQAITYHLADSLPSEAIDRLEGELRMLCKEEADSRRRSYVEEWLDAGHGSCLLGNPLCAECVVDTWKRFDGERYELTAWVVMPNHVHVLIRPREGRTLARIVLSWKSYAARRINEICGGGLGRAGARRSQRVWQRDYWDRFIRNEEHLHAAIEYIHNNPVKAGLAPDATAWQWGSASSALRQAQ